MTSGAYTATAMGKGHERHRLSSRCSRPQEAISIIVTASRGRGSRLWCTASSLSLQRTYVVIVPMAVHAEGVQVGVG